MCGIEQSDIDIKPFFTDFKSFAIDHFGSLTKNGYEVLLFNLLMNHCPAFRQTDDFGRSILLRIPVSKAKRLAYEAELLYGSYQQDDVIKRFFDQLQKADFQAEGKAIKFSLPDKYIRTAQFKQNCCVLGVLRMVHFQVTLSSSITLRLSSF